MLYKLKKTGTRFDTIAPMEFSGLALEKDLEDLLAKHLWDVLFMCSPLMPFAQERPWQPDGDIYALNETGDVVVFELKRAAAEVGAVHQSLRYCEKASRFSYEELERRFRNYQGNQKLSLQSEHQDFFQLERALDQSAFNRNQHLIIVGSAGDSELIRNVDYWKTKGLSLNFIPYRVYHIEGEHYFEFFSLPYDEHANPGDAKGIIVDTNSTYDDDGIWYMCEGDRVAVFGDIKEQVKTFRKGDIAFIYHKGCGIVAAGEVIGKSTDDPNHPHDAMFCKLKWHTTVPKRSEPLKYMPVSQIKKVTGRNFWWAKTLKYPYLDREESNNLLEELKKVLG